MVSSDALNALRTNNKTLVVNGDGYSLRFVGSSIKNTSAPVDTALTFTPSEHGVNFCPEQQRGTARHGGDHLYR